MHLDHLLSPGGQTELCYLDRHARLHREAWDPTALPEFSSFQKDSAEPAFHVSICPGGREGTHWSLMGFSRVPATGRGARCRLHPDRVTLAGPQVRTEQLVYEGHQLSRPSRRNTEEVKVAPFPPLAIPSQSPPPAPARAVTGSTLKRDPP